MFFPSTAENDSVNCGKRFRQLRKTIPSTAENNSVNLRKNFPQRYGKTFRHDAEFRIKG